MKNVTVCKIKSSTNAQKTAFIKVPIKIVLIVFNIKMYVYSWHIASNFQTIRKRFHAISLGQIFWRISRCSNRRRYFPCIHLWQRGPPFSSLTWWRLLWFNMGSLYRNITLCDQFFVTLTAWHIFRKKYSVESNAKCSLLTFVDMENHTLQKMKILHWKLWPSMAIRDIVSKVIGKFLYAQIINYINKFKLILSQKSWTRAST